MSNMTENQQTTTNKSEKKNDLISSFNITLKQFINEISETFPEFQKTISYNSRISFINTFINTNKLKFKYFFIYYNFI